MTAPPDYGSVPPPELLPDTPRRGFFTSALAMLIAGVVTLVPLITGLLFFLDPLLRKKGKPETGTNQNDGFVKLNITLDELKESDVPVQVPVISSKVDKWNRYPDQPIGSVYVQMAEGGQKVSAFNVTCPHLGCAVEYRETPADNTPEYYCPCHNSAFALDGTKKNVIPPRDLDSLEVRIQNGNEIWVKYQEFRATLAEKLPV